MLTVAGAARHAGLPQTYAKLVPLSPSINAVCFASRRQQTRPRRGTRERVAAQQQSRQ
jgi:hypothetical protein